MTRRFWRPTLKIVAVFLVVGALGGFAVAASGVVPVKASSGHWAITTWVLEFGKRRSLATHTLGLTAPPLQGKALVFKGAGHYERGCAPCHGSPERPSPRVAAAMTPHPPDLPSIIPAIDAEELFYVVKHGIKFTGMPAWPVRDRDDEIWAVVAFLLELGKLDAAAYRALIDGDVPAGVPPTIARAPRELTARCARCHGIDGLGRGVGAFPKIAGQQREYITRAMRAYADDSRHSGIMGPVAAALTPEELREFAAYYSGLPSDAEPSRIDVGENPPADASVGRGEDIALRGLPDQGVPSCIDCHGPGTHRRNAAYPNLAGQYADYLVLQLELFTQQRRGGSAYAHIMDHVATRLRPAQMRDVANFYASLSSRRNGEP